MSDLPEREKLVRSLESRAERALLRFQQTGHTVDRIEARVWRQAASLVRSSQVRDPSGSPTGDGRMSDDERFAFVVGIMEAENRRLLGALDAIATIAPMWEGGLGYSKVNLQGTLHEVRLIANAAIRALKDDD